MRLPPWTVVFLLAVLVVPHVEAKKRVPQSHRSGVPPFESGDCPDTRPIKGNFTTYSGGRYMYHMLGQQFYVRTKAERCYASEAEAVVDGRRRSKV